MWLKEDEVIFLMEILLNTLQWLPLVGNKRFNNDNSTCLSVEERNNIKLRDIGELVRACYNSMDGLGKVFAWNYIVSPTAGGIASICTGEWKYFVGGLVLAIGVPIIYAICEHFGEVMSEPWDGSGMPPY